MIRKAVNMKSQLISLVNKKLSEECKEFKNELLAHDSEFVFSQAYHIDVILNIYEILVEKVECMPKRKLYILLFTPNILEWFYLQWLKVEDSYVKELSNSMMRSLNKEKIQMKKGGKIGGYDAIKRIS